jgi:hypothetical protein
MPGQSLSQRSFKRFWTANVFEVGLNHAEVIGERVRDKIAASKRKGLWVGGPVPLGYRCIDKKLEIVPEEAEVVRNHHDRLPTRALVAITSKPFGGAAMAC